MTDDLEPRLQRHLARAASTVDPVPDTADLDARISNRHRRTTRGLAAAAAFALIAGPLAGWTLARRSEPSRVSAGGDQSATDGDSVAEGGSWEPLGGFIDYLGPELPLVGERTTDEGLRLSIRRGQPFDAFARAEEDPCLPDGIVRVGVTAEGLVGVATLETWPDLDAFTVTGAPEGRPVWVVIARGDEGVVEAFFPNGTIDRAEAVDGLAVLAAYADPTTDASQLMYDTVEVISVSDARSVRAAGYSPIPCVASPGPPVTMPEPGEPPVDEAAASAAVTDTFLKAFDGSGEPYPELRERPEVWADSNERFKRDQPEYAAMAPHVYAEVDEVVFTAPDRASVRFRLISDDPSIPAPGERIGVAVLIDGTWKVSIETSCELVGLAGIECDLSL